MFDLNLAAIFSKVVETQSLTKASKLLGIPKATVSRKLSALEDTLGVRLMQRTTRKLNMTDAGRQYYIQCRDALTALHEANLAASHQQEEPSGQLRVSAPIVFGDQFLSQPLMSFMRQYPKIEVKIDLTDRLVDLVEEDVDVAFRVGLLDDSSYVARRIGATRQVTVASPAYLEEFGCPTHPRELTRHQQIAYSDDINKKTLHYTSAEGDVSVPCTPTLTVNNLNVMRDACVDGLGITVLPTFVAHEALRRGELSVILPDWRFVFGALHIIYPSRRHLAAKSRAFIDHMLAIFDHNQPWLPSDDELRDYYFQGPRKLVQ